MAPRPKADRHLPLPTSRDARSRSVSDRSDRSDRSDDSSEHASLQSAESGSKPARKRASKPKVRTGCISCKKRHVKCDERKPGCSRCENLGLLCEGYAPPKAAKQISRTERPLLPRPQLAPLVARPIEMAYQQPPAAPQPPPILISPGLGFELGDDDSWYFALFRDQVAYDLTPCRHDNFWVRTSLRDSMTMRSIRHSILSIGAYARALVDLKAEYPLLSTADRPWWPASVVNRHRQAAFSHHAQALSCLRQDIHTNGVDSRTTMMATLLFIVFENMTGNYHASGNLVRSGIKVLNNIGRTQPRSVVWRYYCDIGFQPPTEIDEMAHMFTRHSTTSVFLPFPHGKSAYHMLFDDEDDEDLFQTDDQLSLDFATRATIPSNTEQAIAIWETLTAPLGRFYAKAAWRNLNPSYECDGDIIAKQAHFLSRLLDFGGGLAALMAVEHDEDKISRLSLLAIQHLASTILVSCCLDRSEVLYDDFTPQFQELVSKIRAYKSLLFDVKTGFSNEANVLPVTAFVASKCRVPGIRLDALDIMRGWSWREGPWDGASLSSAMSCLMQLEGQDDQVNLGTGYMPPPESRYVWTNIFWDTEHRQMTMQYTKVWSSEHDEMQTVSRTVTL